MEAAAVDSDATDEDIENEAVGVGDPAAVTATAGSYETPPATEQLVFWEMEVR
jgi:hypothetical protein